MKKTAIIAGITTGLLLAAFIVSVIITGVNPNSGIRLFGSFPVATMYHSGDQGFHAGDSDTYIFEDPVRDIYIELANSNTTVRVCSTDKVTVKYTPGSPGITFSAKVENEKLRIRESAAFFFIWNPNSAPSTLEIELPEKEYGYVSFGTAAGSTNVEGLICEKFYANTASGHGEYHVFAKEISTDTASGSVRVANCTDRRAESISVEEASGGTDISGFTANTFKIDCASGSVSLSGVSGYGDIYAASGIITVSYAEWDGDLDIDAASGSVDVTLPAGSGADIDLGTFAGNVHYDLDGSSGTLNGNSAVSAGGSNVHYVNVNMVSGSVSLHN